MVQSPNECLALKIEGASGRSCLFMKLKDVYPECFVLIDGSDQLFPLRCLKDDYCPKNQNCMGIIAKRISYIFENFDDVDLLLLYFRYHDRPKSHRAGVFHRNFNNPNFPRFLTFNISAWEKIKKIGTVYSWHLPNHLFLNQSIVK